VPENVSVRFRADARRELALGQELGRAFHRDRDRAGGRVRRVLHQGQEIGVDIWTPFFTLWPSSSQTTHGGEPEG